MVPWAAGPSARAQGHPYPLVILPGAKTQPLTEKQQHQKATQQP